MNTQRRLARDYLRDSNLTDFWQIVTEAKITDDDKVILDMRFVKGYSIQRIAQELFISPEKVNLVIRDTYNRVARLL